MCFLIKIGANYFVDFVMMIFEKTLQFIFFCEIIIKLTKWCNHKNVIMSYCCNNLTFMKIAQYI